jgi:4-hydroxy-tetrahydrodipicolinate synthase
MVHIDGIVPIVPTPFFEDGGIDFDSLKRLIDYSVAAKASAVCLPAYASEFYKLSETERLDVVKAAVGQARGRIPVIAQVNHPSARIAAETARRVQDLGASVVSSAAPRLFPLAEDDLLRYFTHLARAIRLPLLVQDFNPGGPTVGASFAKRLKEAAPNFSYLKLEEPMMGEKLKSILSATAGAVGVLEGWGGLYILELVPAGICGVMPGLPLTELLDRVFRLRRAGQDDEAFDIFSAIMPYILFSLQNMELFHHADKKLLVARGLLPGAHVREATLRVDPTSAAYGDLLARKVLEKLDRLNIPRNPL